MEYHEPNSSLIPYKVKTRQKILAANAHKISTSPRKRVLDDVRCRKDNPYLTLPPGAVDYIDHSMKLYPRVSNRKRTIKVFFA